MTGPESISGAELKVRLGALGLSPRWFAKRLGVTMRTVVRWFDDPFIPPQGTAELEAVSKETLREMRSMAMMPPIAVGDQVVLQTYRTDEDIKDGWPASWHRALTFRVLEHLRALGKTVTVEYVERP